MRPDTITFRVRIANTPALTRELAMQIVLDTDQNATTGNTELVRDFGAEYEIAVYDDQAHLLRWPRAAAARPVLLESAARLGYARGVAAIAVRASALRDPRAFNFSVSTGSGIVPESDGSLDITNAHFDFAPDVGFWTFRAPAGRTLR
jgi:hypothetical protein